MLQKASLWTGLLMPLLIIMTLYTVAIGKTIYVDDDANGAFDGSNWDNAYLCLQNALAIAESGDEVRVAQGVYKPDQSGVIVGRSGPQARNPGDRTASFQLKNGVALMGGYAGIGEPDPNVRNIETYQTILNGDLNGDDGLNFTNYSDNSYHVIKNSGVDETAVLDGFTITSGNAPDVPNNQRGGGMSNIDSNPTIINCTFLRNKAFGDAGGMWNERSSPIITNCRFISNYSGYSGGGMRNKNRSNPILINCLFIYNFSDSRGGGIDNEGAESTSNLILTNCTISRNSSLDGGAIHNSGGHIEVTNCILWNNTFNQISLSEGGTITVTYSNIQQGSFLGEGHNIYADPLFANPENSDFHLKSEACRWDSVSESWVLDGITSPCIDAGDPNTDYGLEPSPNGNRINMGVYGGTEYASKSPTDGNDTPDLDPRTEIIDVKGPVIIDGPWDELPTNASAGLAFDSDWNALTLASDMTNLVFVCEPDPDKEPFTNSIDELGDYKGRLYLGYGDAFNNRGPVDIVCYEPLSGTLIRELSDIDEEHVGRWYTTEGGQQMIACGEDIMGYPAFGSFYINDGLGWQRRQTIYGGVHVNKVIGFKGCLYTKDVYTLGPNVDLDYPYIAVSDNFGATWYSEQIDESVPEFFQMGIRDLDTATHQAVSSGGPNVNYLYTISGMGIPDVTTPENDIRHLYRFDGNNWEQVNISIDTTEGFKPVELSGLQDRMFVWDWEGREQVVCALEGQSQKGVDFLRGVGVDMQIPEACRAANAGWFYFLKHPFVSKLDEDYILYRTQDLNVWEIVGKVMLQPGVEPASISFVHNRLYIGGKIPDQMYRGNYVELQKGFLGEIKDATLHWDADVPNGAQLSFQYRNGREDSQVFVGPDGTSGTYFTASGQALHPQHNGDRSTIMLAMYKRPNNEGELPHVRWVALDTGNGWVTLAVDEGQGLYTAANSNDPNGMEYISPIFIVQEPILYGRLFFEGATPSQTSLRFQVRSALIEEQLKQKTFVGPDGTKDTFYESNGQNLWTGHDGDIYIQYRAVLTSLDPTLAPFLNKVVLVTKGNKLDHFDIQLENPSPWTAGQLNPVVIKTQSASGDIIPINGKVSLSAVAVKSRESLKIEPTELSLSEGVGTVNALLQRATSTEIFVELADIKSSSSIIDVQPGQAHSIEITSNLEKPSPNWYSVYQIAQPFDLYLRVLDRYRNTAIGYTGTVTFERWSYKSEEELLPPYTFQPSDQGCHQSLNAIQIGEDGDWNITCLDEAEPRIAGVLSIRSQ